MQYVDVGVWIHDMVCHERGEEKRAKVGLYRPPTSSSVITHNLKKGGFAAAWELMQPSRLKVVSTSSDVSAPSALEALSSPQRPQAALGRLRRLRSLRGGGWEAGSKRVLAFVTTGSPTRAT